MSTTVGLTDDYVCVDEDRQEGRATRRDDTHSLEDVNGAEARLQAATTNQENLDRGTVNPTNLIESTVAGDISSILTDDISLSAELSSREPPARLIDDIDEANLSRLFAIPSVRETGRSLTSDSNREVTQDRGARARDARTALQGAESANMQAFEPSSVRDSGELNRDDFALEWW
jgi:hypothetical protein